MTSRSLGLPRYITLTNNMDHNGDVDDVTHDTTRHDSTFTFVLLSMCMSSCSVVGWWMSSWCVTTSPPHGKVHIVFDGRWVCLMFHFLLSPFLHVGMLDRFAHSWKVHVHPFVDPWTHLACSPIFLSMSTSLHDCLLMRTSLLLDCLFVCLLANMSLCMYSLFSSHLMSCHLCFCTYIYSFSWWDNIKSIKLLVYHDAWWFRM